jgi:hypothetical protein
VLTGGGRLAYGRLRERKGVYEVHWLHLHALRWEKEVIFKSGLSMASVRELHT